MHLAVVVGVHVLGDEAAQLPEARVLPLVDAVVLEVPEPPLDVDVVRPAALAVHALRDAVALQARDVLVGRVRAALVGVGYGGRAVLGEGPLHTDDALTGLHGVVQPPAHDVAAVPVDDGRQVDVAAPQRDVGDVRGPHLVGEVDPLALEQVGELGVVPGGLARAGLGRDRAQAHVLHQARAVAAAEEDAVFGEVPHVRPGAVRGAGELLCVHDGHGALLLAGEAPVLGLGGVERRPRQADELALARHAQLRVPAHELPPRGRSLQAPL